MPFYKYFKKIITKHSLFVIDGDSEYEYILNDKKPTNIDFETGEIFSHDNSFNNDNIKSLQAIFGDFMEIQL